ncbi:helix-turn-helix domain-containing protein [Persicirhabdus sediminis]|uniref:Helix-turn-helix transcriptional regulator n=1 Tax=Persicirhabdus sediminis TaxID=454144 RepID=A0A8J7MFJ0_9BACT|nr:AraC family transcriptional regulator [Persicirhabdus sediminis]MBK1790864.1 helix-turn-helix transcriptional regulator [Persicirhabdus sediminis]
MLIADLIHTLRIKVYSIEHLTIGDWWSYKNVNSPFTRLYFTPRSSRTYIEHHGERFLLEPGTMVIAPPYTPVNYICEDFCEMYGVIFSAQLGSEVDLFTLNDLNWSQRAEGFIPSLFERLVEINPDRQMKIADPFHKAYNATITAQHDYQQPFHESMETEAIIKLIISRFLESDANPKPCQNQLNQERVLQAIDYIESHMSENLTLDKLSSLANVHPTYFSNVFVDILNVRPSVYIQQKRIEKAQLLLVSTSKPVKQIATEVGFKDPDYFFRAFKKVTGCTPRSYRISYA